MRFFNQLPMGLSMALMENPEASRYFSSLPEQEQKEIIHRAHQMNSRADIERYVRHLPEQKGACL